MKPYADLHDGDVVRAHLDDGVVHTGEWLPGPPLVLFAVVGAATYAWVGILHEQSTIQAVDD